jgi:hypothetical protein
MFVKHFAKVFLEIPRAPGAIFFHAKAWTQMRVKTHGKSAHPGFTRARQKKKYASQERGASFLFSITARARNLFRELLRILGKSRRLNLRLRIAQ